MLAKSLQSCLLATLWTLAHQFPLTMGLSRQAYWSGFLWPPPGDLPDLGLEPTSLTSLYQQAGSLPLAPLGDPHRGCMYCAQSLSHVQLFAILWTVATRLLCPWGFSRLEYRSGLPCPPPGDLPNLGMEPSSLALQANSLLMSHRGSQKLSYGL